MVVMLYSKLFGEVFQHKTSSKFSDDKLRRDTKAAHEIKFGGTLIHPDPTARGPFAAAASKQRCRRLAGSSRSPDDCCDVGKLPHWQTS